MSQGSRLQQSQHTEHSKFMHSRPIRHGHAMATFMQSKETDKTFLTSSSSNFKELGLGRPNPVAKMWEWLPTSLSETMALYAAHCPQIMNSNLGLRKPRCTSPRAANILKSLKHCNMRSRIVREGKAACPIIFKYKTRQKSTQKKQHQKAKLTAIGQ